MPRFRPPGPCPVCHEHVPHGRRACSQCGSSADDGWGGDTSADGLDLPDDEFDYDDFVAREFGGPRPRGRKPPRHRWRMLWGLVALALAAILAGAGWFTLR